jgi:hypothetical protein
LVGWLVACFILSGCVLRVGASVSGAWFVLAVAVFRSLVVHIGIVINATSYQHTMCGRSRCALCPDAIASAAGVSRDQIQDLSKCECVAFCAVAFVYQVFV